MVRGVIAVQVTDQPTAGMIPNDRAVTPLDRRGASRLPDILGTPLATSQTHGRYLNPLWRPNMSDKRRWRWGDPNPVNAAVDSATVIETSDLLWQDVDDAKPASAFPLHDFHESTYQSGFADQFLGVAMHRNRSGDTSPIRVATTGVFEFDYDVEGDGGTFELGDLIGVADILHPGHPDVGDGSETPGLMNQQVEKVSDSRRAIGRVDRRAASPATSVLVRICSTVMTGGVAGTTKG